MGVPGSGERPMLSRIERLNGIFPAARCRTGRAAMRYPQVGEVHTIDERTRPLGDRKALDELGEHPVP